MSRRLCPALVVLALVTSAAPASADITGFVGLARTSAAPVSRDSADVGLTKGVSLGFSLVIVGFEFELAQSNGDDVGDSDCTGLGDFRLQCAPTLTTGMANVLLQTPRGVGPLQFYATAGAGLYRERYGPFDENDYGVGTNVGGGVKIEIAGPLRLRLDYRVFKLANDAANATPQRVYAGANIAF